MGVRVLTLSGETTQDGSPLLASSSNVFKISTPLLGSGTPYTPLADGEATNNGSFYEGFTVFRDEENNLSREKLENARYEAATYAHELEIYLANQSAAGTKYYFSPDVRVLVNGH